MTATSRAQTSTETVPGSGSGSGSWRTAASNGAVVAAAGLVVMMVLAREVIVPVIVIVVLFLTLATLLRRIGGRWPLYVGMVFPVLAVVGNAPFIVGDLAHPESGAGFIPQVVLLPAMAFTVLASVMARTASARAVRPVAVALTALAVLAGLGSVAATLSVSDDIRRDGDVEVVAERFEYPDEIRATAGDVGFFVRNDDPVRHTFRIEGTAVEQELPGGTDRRVSADLEPGTYRFYCDVAGHEDMEGTLVIE